MGRPARPSEECRTVWVSFRVTAAEWARLNYNAAACDISLSAFARQRSLDEFVLPKRQQTAARDRALLANLGNNANQIAKHANAGRSLPPDPVLHALCDRINHELDRQYGPRDQFRGPHL